MEVSKNKEIDFLKQKLYGKTETKYTNEAIEVQRILSLSYIKLKIDEYRQILTDSYEKTQSGLCFTVIGSIFLIIAVLFFILSFVKQTNVIVGINVFSMQFYIFIISVVIGGLSLTYGLYKTITSHLRRKIYQKEINILAKLKD